METLLSCKVFTKIRNGNANSTASKPSGNHLVSRRSYLKLKTFNFLIHNVPNGQTHVKNLAAFAERFLKCV